jgi:hypothetical protein
MDSPWRRLLLSAVELFSHSVYDDTRNSCAFTEQHKCGTRAKDIIKFWWENMTLEEKLRHEGFMRDALAMVSFKFREMLLYVSYPEDTLTVTGRESPRN